MSSHVILCDNLHLLPNKEKVLACSFRANAEEAESKFGVEKPLSEAGSGPLNPAA